MGYNEENSIIKEMFNMRNMNKEVRLRYREMLERLDDDIKEIEEIHREQDELLYDIERRIEKLRKPKKD